MQKQKVDHRPMQAAASNMKVGRLRLDLDASTVIGHVVILLVIALVTAGIGLIFFPYAAVKLILNSIIVTDELGRSSARLNCQMGWAELTGHGVIWALLVGFTGGLMAPFYVFALAQFAVRRTVLIST